MDIHFKDIAVSKKLIAVFICILAVTVTLGLFAQNSLSRVSDKSEEIRANWLPSVQTLSEYQYALTRQRTFVAAVLAAKDDAARSEDLKNAESFKKMADAAWAKYLPWVTGAQEKTFSDKIQAAHDVYAPMVDQMENILKTQGQEAAGDFYAGPMRHAFNTLITAVRDDLQYNSQGGSQAALDGQAIFQTARLWIYVAMGLAALFCAAAGYVLIRAISKPLGDMTEAMGELARGNLNTHVPHADQRDEIGKLAEAMTTFKNQLAAAEHAKEEQTQIIVSSIGAGLDHLAKGDLTHRVTADLTGAFAKLKEDFNRAMSRLQDTVKSVLGSTHQIATGASEISTAADDLSRRTEQQAASLEETAAALEEITATVKKTATNAKEASHSVIGAKNAAESGGRVVETAVRAMDAIAQSSKQITDITGVIDEIAFQTNLLALNAGVEAARAGEAGRGFAVVASEVRALAQRSGEAAKQIKTLINTSSEHVGDGVKFVGETGQALKAIVDQVLQINALVSEMAQAAEQQSTGIEQVNAAVAQMDQVTQQNAAMVEESTAASRSLAGETEVLTRRVSFFSVGEESRFGAPTTVRTTAAPALRAPNKSRQSPPIKAVVRSGARSAAVALASKAEPTEDPEWSEF